MTTQTNKTKEVNVVLGTVTDPLANKTLQELNAIKDVHINGQEVICNLELLVGAHPKKAEIKEASERALLSLDWVEQVTVKISSQNRPSFQHENGLANVSHIIAVSSCKGGVGKSTIAVNLAYTLAQQGAKVGIFDADVYGPSLPTMVKTTTQDATIDGANIVPLEHENVKLMSFGFVQVSDENKGPAIMRGPMITQIIKQLLTGTQWGDLDYLIIDMPPGTGDVQITLGQTLAIRTAVIVTTPQHISVIDVEKGIEAFNKLEVPTAAIVENMSTYTCESCHVPHRIFGDGQLDHLCKKYAIKHSISLDIQPQLSESSDNGHPYILTYPNSSITNSFKTLSNHVVTSIIDELIENNNEPTLIHQKDTLILTYKHSRKKFMPLTLRSKCTCAHCIDEFTNESKLTINELPKDIKATSISNIGNYAFAINWSDGHQSLFPYKDIITY